MFWKKKKSRMMREVNVEAHLRAFLYDTQLGDAENLALYLGATPISEEGVDHERAISDKRVDRISHLIPLVHSYSHLITEAMVGMEKSSEEEAADGLPDAFWEMFRTMLEKVAMSVAVGVLSQVTDMEMMKVQDR